MANHRNACVGLSWWRRLAPGLALCCLLLSFPAMAQTSADDLQTRFDQFYSQGHYEEAVPIAEQLEALFKSKYGERSGAYGAALYQLGNVLVGTSRHDEAATNLRLALAIFASDVSMTPQRLQTEVMLATALIFQSKLDEGVPMMQRATAAFEATFGIADPRTVSALNNLAQTLQVVGRNNEAEPVYRKLIASLDPALSTNLANFGTLHGNLGAVLTQLGRPQEAIVEARKSVDYLRRIGNPNHRFLLIAISNLGKLEHDAGNFAAAEALYRESLDGAERGGGRRSEIYAGSLINMAVLQRDMGKPVEAEATVRAAVPIFEQTLGPQHPRTGSAINNLAVLASARGDWTEAMQLYDRASEIAIRNARAIGLEDGRLAASVYGLNPGDFPAHMRAIFHAARNDPARRAQAFALAQRSLNSSTAAAVARMASRAATEGSALGLLVRRRQDLLRDRAAADQALVAVLAATQDVARYQSADAELQRIERDLQEVDRRLRSEFPDYNALDSSEPVALADVQRALNPHEALVAFVEVAGNLSLPGELYAWVVTRQQAAWIKLDVRPEDVATRVGALRCGLDAAAWRAPPGADFCRRSTGRQLGDDGGRLLPFDFNQAYELFKELFGPIEATLQLPDGSWRDLLVVASGPLGILPLATLVTSPPPAPFARDLADYRQIKWLGQRQAITVLPAVSSITALRRIAKPSGATRPMIGFGNPLLDGADDTDRPAAEQARLKQACGGVVGQKIAMNTRARREVGAVRLVGGLADVAKIRAAPPLPETADEICAIAVSLRADLGDMRLGARASETAIKELSSSGELAKFRVLHFATHGTAAGQLLGEPGLVLTPPAVSSALDDGFLTASEVAALKLDADWVILSACNTAGSDGTGADALTGLARAFFYAGARALMVSHWEVDSPSTVRLVSSAVSAISRDDTLGRAEALKRAMAELVEHGEPHQAHPAFWAPFIVVGEGGR